MKEIYKKEEFKNTLLEVINEMADTVCLTYGPDGHTVIITDKDTGEPYATKDGVSVNRSISFKDPVKNYICSLIKQVSEKTLSEAGDGTTTSICLTRSFINKGFELLKEGYSYNELKTELETLENDCKKFLEKNSKKLKKKDIYHVASISSNNDKEIADIVTKAFQHSNIVKVEEGNSFNDDIVKVNGMKLVTTYFDQGFINNESKFNIEYGESLIALIDGKLESLKPIEDFLVKLNGKPLIVIADHFSENVVSILKSNYNRGSLKIALVKSPGIGSFRKNVMSDISDYTGAQLLDPNKKYIQSGYLGIISGIQVNKENTIILNENELSPVKDKINKLKEYLETDIDKREKDLIQQRIEQLTGSTSIIKVGGKSDVEIKERLDRIDDAVRAVSCALEEGVIEGGGVSLVKSILGKDNKFNSCLTEPYKYIFKPRSFNIDEDIITMFNIGHNMFELNIIDPLKVTRSALENAISVSKTLLNTEAVVINRREWNQ